MALNGETPAQMEYAEDVKEAGGVSLNEDDGNDTSKDQDWEYSDHYTPTDFYVLITTVLWMLPKLLVFLPLSLLLCFVPVLMARLYGAFLPEGLERVPRSKFFYLWFWVAFITGLPAFFMIITAYFLDCVAYYIFGIIYCFFTCGWCRWIAGEDKLRPFRGGPSLILKAPDIFICLIGQTLRQGFGEILYCNAMMWVLMPWLKYYINANPLIYDLDHRMVQQISTRMDELGPVDRVTDDCRQIISQARCPREKAHRIDLWSFVPHYPYPPADRRWAVGMQMGGGAYPSKFTLLVHTTHADAKACPQGGPTKAPHYDSKQGEGEGVLEQFVLSNSIARPVYRVMLWYSNPYHFFTGWVEASISTGLPSQPDKLHGGEHPMWLVSGKTFLTAHRDSYCGSGMIDWFFDYWLPVFVHEVRFSMTYRTKIKQGMSKKDATDAAIKYAASRYQEVSSKDGVSQPRELMGLDAYKGESTLDTYQKEGALEKKDDQHARDDSFDDDVAVSERGKKIVGMAMGQDIHEPAADSDEEEEDDELEPCVTRS